MTDDQIRIKVAEALGYEVGYGEILTIEPDRDGEPNIVDHRPIPNYPEDLNACAKMEDSLTDDERSQYCGLLHKICVNESWAWSATARQRCEAFLKVKGLWRDE